MIINHNISAINANRLSKMKDMEVQGSMEKLSSGMRINRGGDDPSGLAVSEKMRSQVRGLNRASQNALDSISLVQVAEGYLAETTEVLQRLRELSVQSSNGIYTDEDRMQVQVEVEQLVDEVNRIASHAQFNTLNLLTGSFAADNGINSPQASMWVHVGANMDQRERLFIGTMTARGLGLESVSNTHIGMSTANSSNAAIGVLDEALKKVSGQRANLGAYQMRMEHVINSNDVGSQNLQAAESRIRDTNMASEMSNLTKEQILGQAALSMVAQANSHSQQVLSLLR